LKEKNGTGKIVALTTFSGGKGDSLPPCQCSSVTLPPITRCDMLTFEKVNSVFEYRDGLIYKKLKSGVVSSRSSGTATSNGYAKVGIDGKSYLVHRVIYLMQHKFLPDFIDHIDNNPLNNKIENLRACSRGQNKMNARKHKSNRSGHKGVSFHKKSQKWIVEVQVNKVRKYLGIYSDFDLACLVSDEARNLYHKEFSNHD